MPEFITSNADALLAFGALAGVAWFVFRRKGLAHGDRVAMQVYCMHCNWEGRVTRGSMRCNRCQSRNLGVIAV